MAQVSRGFCSWLCCAPEDPLDTLYNDLWKNHLKYARETAKDALTHGLDPLGFSDPLVRDKLWKAAAVQKAAVYDQFYTFMCWACPVGCNAFCCCFCSCCCDCTHLERRMVDGSAMQMTCGPCCGGADPPPEAFSLYHGASVKNDGHDDIRELIVIASCPGDHHQYFTLEEFERAELKAIKTATDNSVLLDDLWFSTFIDELGEERSRAALLDVKKSDYEEVAGLQHKRTLLPLGVKAATAAAAATEARKREIQHPGDADAVKAAAATKKTAAGAAAEEASSAGDEAWRQKVAEMTAAAALESKVTGIHSKLKDMARLSQGYVLFSPIQFLDNETRRDPKYKGLEPQLDVKAHAVAKDHYCTQPAGCPECARIDSWHKVGDPKSNVKTPDPTYLPHKLWQAYWMANVREGIVSAMNKYTVDSIKIVAVYGGGPGAKYERFQLNRMGLVNRTLQSAKGRTQCCFQCLMCCSTCGAYQCAKCCPGCRSGIYMGEAVVLRFLLCADPRDVEVSYATVDFNDLVDYLSPATERGRYSSQKEYKRRDGLLGRKDELKTLKETFPGMTAPGCCASFFCGATVGRANGVAAEPTPPPQQVMGGRGLPKSVSPDLTAVISAPSGADKSEVSKSRPSSGWTREGADPVLTL